MLTLLLLTVAACLAFCGWGRVLHDFLGRFGYRGMAPSASDCALLGMFLVTSLALAWNFFVALTGASGVAVIGAGVALFALQGRGAPRSRVFALATLIGAAYFSFRIVRYLPSYDAGLYHVPFLKWMAQYPAPIGLANLEERLGFDSAWLVLHGAMRLPFMGWSTLSMVECTAWVLGACVVVEGAAGRWKGYPPLHRALAYAVGLLFLLYAVRWGARFVSSTDSAPNIFATLAALYFVECGAHLRMRKGPDATRALLLLAVCCCLAIAGKLSMLPIAVLALGAVALTANGAGARRDALIVTAAGSLFLALWILRNVLLSGCLAYPVAISCVDGLSWGVGSGRAAASTAIISEYAHRYLSSGEISNLEPDAWVPMWAHEILTNKAGIYVVALLLVGTWFAVRASWRSKSTWAAGAEMLRSREHLLLALTAILGLSLWATTVPHLRFSWSFLLLAVVPVYAYLFASADIERIVDGGERLLRRKPVAWTLVGTLAVLVVVRTVQYPGTAEVLAVPKTEYRSVNSGPAAHLVHVPLKGDQCWDVPLPCTPSLHPGLHIDSYAGRPRFRILAGPN